MLLTAETPPDRHCTPSTGPSTGPVVLPEHDAGVALLGTTTVTAARSTSIEDDGHQLIQATLDTGPLTVGSWTVGIELTPARRGRAGRRTADATRRLRGRVGPIEVAARPFAAGDDVAVTMKRTAVPPTADQALWVAIRNSTNALGFDNYSRFLDRVMCGDRRTTPAAPSGKDLTDTLRQVKRRTALPFPNVDRYRLLKAATEVFLMIHCGVDADDFSATSTWTRRAGGCNRTVSAGDLEAEWREYLVRVAGRRRRLPRRAAVPRS